MATISTIRRYENPALLIKNLSTSTPKFGSLRLLHLKTKASSNYDNPLPNLSQVQPLFTHERKLTKENQPPLFEFDKYFVMKKKLIERALDEAVPLQHPYRLYEAMRYSLLAGRERIFAVLCLAACELVGGDELHAIPTACATEMIKTFFLIHDDLPCMDNDDFRHGKPSTHKAFGEATAILAGDALLSAAFQHIVSCHNTMKGVEVGQQLVQCISELASAIGSSGSIGGQFIDIYSEGKDVTLEELECIHVQKTAKLVQAVVVCGAIIGGGNEIQVEQLRKFAWFLGMLIQVANDISDVTKSSEELGKTAGTDLLNDKATYPKLMGIEGAKTFAGELLTQAYEELAHFDAVRAAPLYGFVNYAYHHC